MKPQDINRVKKAIKHLTAAQKLLLNIDWVSISDEQYAFLCNAYEDIDSAKENLDSMLIVD